MEGGGLGQGGLGGPTLAAAAAAVSLLALLVSIVSAIAALTARQSPAAEFSPRPRHCLSSCFRRAGNQVECCCDSNRQPFNPSIELSSLHLPELIETDESEI